MLFETGYVCRLILVVYSTWLTFADEFAASVNVPVFEGAYTLLMFCAALLVVVVTVTAALAFVWSVAAATVGYCEASEGSLILFFTPPTLGILP